MALLLLLLSFAGPSLCLVSPLTVVRDLFTSTRPPDHAISRFTKLSGDQLLRRAGYEVLRDLPLEKESSKRAIVARGSGDAWFELECEFGIAFPSLIDLKERERKEFSGESRVEFVASATHRLVALFLPDLDDLLDEHQFLEQHEALFMELASTRDRFKSSKGGHVVGAVFLPTLELDWHELSRMGALRDFFDEHELFLFVGSDLHIEAAIAELEAETAAFEAETAAAKGIIAAKDKAIEDLGTDLAAEKTLRGAAEKDLAAANRLVEAKDTDLVAAKTEIARLRKMLPQDPNATDLDDAD